MSEITRNELGHILPGQRSLNPLGRPKAGSSFKDIIAWKMAQSADGTEKSTKQAIIEKITELAMDGREWACIFVADRLEGKVSVPVEVGQRKSPLEGVPDEEIIAALDYIKQQRIAQKTDG